MNNMVFEDAQMILSYASPYKVTLNLERDNKAPSSRTANKKNKLNKRALGSDSYQKTMLHPLYRTRSVDNLTQIGKYDKQPNYGTASHRRFDNQAAYLSDNSGNAYSRMISKFKQQLLTYLQDSSSTHAEHVERQPVDQQVTDGAFPEKKQPSQLMRPLTSIQNLFKPNRLNWPEEYSGQNHLNSVVVGNSLALGNPGFQDDDEDDEFRKEYQLSQLKYQQQYQPTVPTFQQQQPLPSANHALRHQNSLQAAAHYSRSSQPTNLIKYHQQTMTDLSQVDSVQAMNQFVNVNLNDLNQRQRARHEEMDYSNSVRKGNSTTQLNDLNKSLTSSSQFISVPLTLADEHTNEQQQQTNQQLPQTTVAQVHAAADQSSVGDIQSKSPAIDSESKSSNKPRSSSMGDLPNESVVSMHPEVTGASASNQYQSTLERAISLDLSNSTGDQQAVMNSKLSKSVFSGKFNKQPDDHQSRHRRLIKSKNQANLNQQKHSSSLGDITYEQTLTHSLSNGKLSNQSKSIRNSLSSTNSTCSSPSLPSGSSDTKMEYDDHSILMLKSSPEENNSILIRDQRLEQPSSLEHPRLDDELDGKESILFVSDQHKTSSMMDSRQQTERNPSVADDQLFANKEQAKKIINDVFTMSSIRTLNAIKSDKQLNDLFRSNQQAKESEQRETAAGRLKSGREIGVANREITPNIANFKISSTKKEIPVRISSLSTSDHSSTNPFSSNVPSRDNLFANSDRSDQSINKENRENDQQLNRPDSSSSITDDEIAQLKNRVSKLKKEFSLRQKQIESQNKQSSVTKFKRSTSEQQPQQQAKQVLSENSRPSKRPPTGSISKKQEQILNSTAIDFESWSWNQDSWKWRLLNQVFWIKSSDCGWSSLAKMFRLLTW